MARTEAVTMYGRDGRVIRVAPQDVERVRSSGDWNTQKPAPRRRQKKRESDGQDEEDA